ncbi:MAG: LacI family transcriptional regulator [Opitutaceae bacterium]|jgi:DNA-binding LacI/PurR family transcriptional regulator|nr:LacI family transcriptional regulator [Opitutaceae bacterium]
MGAKETSGAGKTGSGKRVTQQDIADRVGVSRSAVSMAFRNHQGISAAMRERIQKEATGMGYAPDPMLASLAAYRNRQRPASFHGTLAWLVNTTSDFQWDTVGQFTEVFEGARDSAARHGFTMEVFDVARDGAPRLARAGAVLRARNVAGILVAPQPAPDTSLEEFPWADFSAVASGYTLARPRLHVVAAAQFSAVLECLRQLRETGHRRIGFWLSPMHLKRTRLQYLGAWLASQEVAGLGGQVLAVLREKEFNPGVLDRWLRRYRPDGIISSSYMPDRLRELGWRVPEDVSVVCPHLPNGESPVSGVCEAPRDCGSAAADLLVSLIHRGERGMPRVPRTVLVDGCWVEGKTLRARSLLTEVRVAGKTGKPDTGS